MSVSVEEMHRAYFTLYGYFRQKPEESLLDAAQRFLLQHEYDVAALMSVFALTYDGKGKTWWPGIVAAAQRASMSRGTQTHAPFESGCYARSERKCSSTHLRS